MDKEGGVTSAAGVNHRSWNRGAAAAGDKEPPSSRRKAVSERLNSAATACIQHSSAAASRRHTAAGLPLNGPAAKASTCDDDDVTGDAGQEHEATRLAEGVEQP